MITFAGACRHKGRTYVFIDEPQRIDGWQDAVNATRVDFDCDIYLTGSNAYLLSSELATYLSGRYVEVKMLPLSFSEFADFCGIEFVSGTSVALTPEGSVLFDDMLTRYLEYGGMPAIASSRRPGAALGVMSGVYEAIAVRDIVNRERGKGKSA
ncbi:MAG: AAA family ATPase [Collinsella sp.]